MSDARISYRNAFCIVEADCGFDPARTAIRTYLFGAVRNQSLNACGARAECGTGTDGSATPETEALRGEMAEAVAGAIAELPRRNASAAARALDNCRCPEIAEITQLEVTA